MPKKRKAKKNNIDFFGLKKSPKFFSEKSNINFLNSNKKVKKRNDLLIGNKKPSQKRKKLKPYGDFDLDGSPNKFDCDPFDPAKDAKIIEKLKGLFGRKPLKPIPIKEIRRRQTIKRERERTEQIISEVRPKFRAEERKRKRAKFEASSAGKFARRLAKAKIPIISKKKFEKVRVGVEKVVTEVGIARIPRKTKSRKGESVRSRPGRPRGTFKFSIPGKGPVPIHVYKKWLAQQKALARIKALEHVKTIQAQQTGQTPPTEIPIEEEEFEEEFEEPSTPQPRPQQIQQQVQQPSQVVGGPVGDNILQAPNVFKGELRNVRNISAVQLGERPQANPEGENFTQIDPITGRPIVQRRISEKFATGEAL